MKIEIPKACGMCLHAWVCHMGEEGEREKKACELVDGASVLQDELLWGSLLGFRLFQAQPSFHSDIF